MSADVTSGIKKTHDHLQTLHSQIEQGDVLFDNATLSQIIAMLHEDSNFLTRHEHNMEKMRETMVPIDAKIKRDIIDLIRKILHSPQAVGTFQKELFPVLHRIESAISQWKSKVEKVDNER